MSRVKRNVAANLAGGLWIWLVSILFIPLYLRYLGVEAYGLIGFFATVQAVFGILDFGLGLTLTRGLARLEADGDKVQQRDLLRTVELIYWGIAIVTAAAIMLLARPIASSWVNAQTLSPDSVTTAVRLMGAACALQFPFALYKAGLMGLQKQVTANVVTAVVATVRGVGVVALLAFVAATVEVFFLGHVVLALVQTAVTFTLIWRAVGDTRGARFRGALLKRESAFAAGVSANALVGIFLTQADKILLSGLLPLREFGYYMLAATVAGALWWLIVPINTALFPRFAQLTDASDHAPLCELYHKVCQVMAAVLLPIAGTLILFSREVLMVWTGDTAVADGAALPAAILVAGTLVNGLISVPGYLSSAAGWPELMMFTNLGAAAVLVPALVYLASHYGGPGAALVWLVVNLTYLVITVPIMHRRLLVGELRRWYHEDVFLPMAAVAAVGLPMRLLMPASTSRVVVFAYVSVAGLAMAAAVLAGAPRARALAVASLRFVRENPA
jgi:O-antigen/teichoic acid export membrane protein